jgi:hypothetical protein
MQARRKVNQSPQASRSYGSEVPGVSTRAGLGSRGLRFCGQALLELQMRNKLTAFAAINDTLVHKRANAPQTNCGGI